MRGPFFLGSAAARPAWLLAFLACLTVVGVRLETAPWTAQSPAAEQADRDPRVLPTTARAPQHAVAGARSDRPSPVDNPPPATPPPIAAALAPTPTAALSWGRLPRLAAPRRRRGRFRPREPPLVPAVHHP